MAPKTPAPPTDLYDYARIAKATGLPAPKLRVWYQRGNLPPADFRVGASPAWLPSTIEPWIATHTPHTPA